MNYIGVYTVALKEIKRSIRVPFQLIGTPVVTTLLYFLIFGAAIGSRIGQIAGLSYTEFIVPGLIMMNVLTTAFQSVAFGIMFARIVGRTINDLLIAPMSYMEIALGFTLASIVRSLLVGIVIFLTALFFIPFRMDHALLLLTFTCLVAAGFSFFGLVVGIWAKSFEQLTVVPTFIIMPLSFLGGVFYSADMLPPFARMISLYNPAFYMINGMRYGFYSIADVSPLMAIVVTIGFALVFLAILWQMLRVGYNLRS